MNENFKYIAKLSVVAISSFIKINVLSIISTLTVVVIEFIILIKNIDSGQSGHVSAIPFLVVTFTARPIGFILCCLTLICSPFLFFALGNKYILTKLTNKLITDKSENLVYPILDKIMAKFQTKQPKILKNAADFSLNKLKLIHEIRNDTSENKWLRRVIIFGMKKIELNDIDFSNDGISFYEIIKIKTIQSLQNISEPSRKPIWIVIAIQWTLLLFIWKTKY